MLKAEAITVWLVVPTAIMDWFLYLSVVFPAVGRSKSTSQLNPQTVFTCVLLNKCTLQWGTMLNWLEQILIAPQFLTQDLWNVGPPTLKDSIYF